MLERHENLIAYENALAEAMLQEAEVNSYIKSMLATTGHVVIDKVLDRMIQTISDHNKPMPSYLHNAIKTLAEKHCAPEKPFGALMPEVINPADITHTSESILGLLHAIKNSLAGVEKIRHRTELLQYMKSLVEIGWCYYELFNEFHTANFSLLKTMLWPTQEELDIRLRRSEMGESPQTALTYGIGTTPGKDLAPASDYTGMLSGKTVFGHVGMKKRLEFITDQFDRAASLRDEYGRLLTEQIEVDKIQAQLKELEDKQYFPSLKKMQYYKIPLDKSSRAELAYYARLQKTSFEKLANMSCDSTKSLPLLASVSGSTARTIVMLQDIGAFNDTDGLFDFNKAQVLLNCCMAFYIQCGHHSFLEVAEIYNRLIDYIAIERQDLLPQHVFSASHSAYMRTTDIPERRLPYYHIGNYTSFLHHSYCSRVSNNMDKNNMEMRR